MRRTFTLTRGATHVDMLPTVAKFGFTLAEVLITLGIIGIVAAITIPGLINKYEEKSALTKINQTYSILTSAYKTLLEEYGSPESWEKGYSETFSTVLKVANNCGINNNENKSTPCFHNEYYPLTKTKRYKIAQYRKNQVQLMNGVSIAFPDNFPIVCNGNTFSNSRFKNSCGEIVVDINGPQKPNTFGIDFFGFTITATEIIPMGVTDEPYYWTDRSCNIFNGDSFDGVLNGKSCSAWAIYKKNMDYKRCQIRWKSKYVKCK